MKSPLKLYWVETPSPEENCFIIAHNKRAAARYEEDSTGFNPGDCKAELVRALQPDEVISIYGNRDEDIKDVSAFYVYDRDLEKLDINSTVIEGDDVFTYGEREYSRQGGMNYIASLTREPRNIIIRTVGDLLEIIARDAPGDWIFRGHSSCRWELKSSAHRMAHQRKLKPTESIAVERGLLGEFKRRARMFLPNPPGSDWEWMVLAQHFGLPTRLLDWTENPLVALYFAVRENDGELGDGILYAYRHNDREVEITSATDPFSIEKIEVVRPPHLDQRVIAQQSVFTAEPASELADEQKGGNSDLRYWYVSCVHVLNIKDELSKLGISESTLFPGLSTLAAEIREDPRYWAVTQLQTGDKS